MADAFDSSALFAEFNRPRQASDRLLMSTISGRSIPKGSRRRENGAQSGGGAGNEEAYSSDSGDGSSESDDEGPVEVGVDEAGCVIYRPGARERRVGMKLLQNADYGETDGPSHMDDMGGGNVDELHRLHEMNAMYKKQTRLIDPTRHIPVRGNEEGPALQVLFMNHRFSRKYRTEIERFVADLIYRDYDDGSMKPVRTRPHHVCVAEGSADVKDQETSINEHRTSTVIGCSRFYTEFTLDHMGFPLVDYIPALSEGWDIPRYEQQFRKVMPVDDESDDEDKPPKPAKVQRGCFNCGGQHALNDCQEQRDFQRIAASRRRFQEQAAARQPQGTLNKGIAEESKFAAFKPGVYSDALLQGLGLQPGQVPFFAYKMRILGYPPGYLREAEVDWSGITMFDRDGQAPNASGEEGAEDGERTDEDDERVVYDVDKLIDFPGFNVPLPEGMEDEGHRYGFPPMHPKDSKERMQRMLPTPKGVKRAHSNSSSEGPQGPKKRCPDEDMDIVDSDRGSAVALSRTSSQNSMAGRSNTPTLEDLELQQRFIQEQLRDGDSSQGSSTGTPARNSSDPDLHRFTMPDTPGGGTPPVTPRGAGTPIASSTPGYDPFTTPISCHSANSSLNRSASISKTMSTPVTKVCTEDLPDADLFRLGVQEHIPFENLPDAIGTYDKMKGIITQIRELKKKSSQ